MIEIAMRREDWCRSADSNPHGFPPSKSRCLTTSRASTFFHLQPYPVQHPHCPSERFRLDVCIGLRRQPDVGASSQFLHHERIFGMSVRIITVFPRTDGEFTMAITIPRGAYCPSLCN
jgi:hypothetical protein